MEKQRNKTIIQLNRCIHILQTLKDTELPYFINKLTNNSDEIFEIQTQVNKELKTAIENVRDIKAQLHNDFENLMDLEYDFKERNNKQEDKKYFKQECKNILQFLREIE